MLALLTSLLLTAAPPVLPDETAPLIPGRVRVEGAESIPSANFTDAKNCGSCHADIAAQWQSSTHALASFTNPLYRVAIDRLRLDRGTKESRMCGSCHDLALLTSGALDEPEIRADDPRAHAAVSCTTCHSTTHATLDGNGSLTLRADPVFPSAPEDSTLEKHRARVASPVLRTAQLCATCHRSFLGDETGNASAFFGMDDYGTWHRSAYAGDGAERPDHVAAQDCRACHMQREQAVLGDVAAKNGTVPSHRFLGAHTTLAAMRKDDAQLARLQAFLRGAATIDVSAARRGQGAWALPAERLSPKPGDVVEVDLTVFNERTGHRFPGGVLDNQGTTVEATITDAKGKRLGVTRAQELRAQVVDAQGQPVQRRETHTFVAAVWNHTVPPRDARITRVRFTVPPDAVLPLTIDAQIVHRARSPELMQLACDESKTPRGQAFLHAGFVALDPCVTQPETVIDHARLTFGQPSRDTWARALRYGLGLSVSLQEYLDEAQGAFTHAAAIAKTPAQRGTSQWALGQLAGKRGQLDAALAHLAKAERLLGATPAIRKARGDAYGQVWRWKEAAESWRLAVEQAPTELGLWQSLAMASASTGDWEGALQAAQQGLWLQPRDADCLRVQALALGQLGRPDDGSLEAALRWRLPDDGPRAKALCSANVEGCAARRNPVPVFDAN